MSWFIFAAALIGLSVLIWPRKPKGPVFEGRTIAEWFDEAAENQGWLYSSKSPLARDAFEYFGARAQPFLLQWAQKEPPALAKLRDNWLSSLPKWLQTWPRKIHSQQWYVERRRLALQMLGFVEQWERARPGGSKHAALRLATNALPVFVRALGDTNQTIRLTAACSLRNLGENAWPAIPNLTESVTDSYLQVAIVSMQTLGNMGWRASNAVPTLASIACDQANPLRVEAVKALGAIGPAARSVSPKLASFLTNDVTTTQAKNSESASQDDTDQLASFLKNAGRLPPKGNPVSEQSALSNILRHVSAWPPSNAVTPFALKLPPGSVVSSVVTYGNPPTRLTVPNDRQFRDAVADALVKIGELSDATTPALERMLQPEGPNRATLAVAMWQRNPEDSTAQRYIVGTMRSDDWLHRMRAARLLGEAGTNAAVFLPELRRLLEDSELLVRKSATSAVERVTSTPL